MSFIDEGLVTPAELTGYARENATDYENSAKGSLARWLPNRTVPSFVVTGRKGDYGLVDEALFRAFGAEPAIGVSPVEEQFTVALPAIAQNIPLDEYTELRARNSSEDARKKYILTRTERVVRAILDRMEKMRGIVLATGKATIDQTNFKLEDDFGRSPDLTVTASTKWDQSGAKILDDIRAWADKYAEKNGQEPGSIVVSRRIARVITAAADFQINLAGGGSRPGTLQQVNDYLASDGLPWLTVYSRRTKSGPVIPDDTMLLLPEAGGVTDDDNFTLLGGTFWGESASAHKPGWNIADDEKAGIVVAAFEGDRPSEPIEVIADAIGLPILANANLSMAATVL